MRRAFNGVIFVNILNNISDLCIAVAEAAQGHRDGPVDNLEHATAGQQLVFHQRDIGLHTGGVAIHHECNRTGRGEHGHLGIAIAIAAAQLDGFIAAALRGSTEIIGAARVNPLHRIAVHFHHVEHRFPVFFVAFKSAFFLCQTGGLDVRLQVQDRRQRAGNGATFVAVVRQTERHQEAAEVGKPQAEWAEFVAVAGDGFGGVAGIVDENFLGRDVNFGGGLVAFDVKAAVIPAEFHQVQRRQIAGGIIEEHVFAARIRRVDRGGIFAGVPALDGILVLHARIAAGPGAFGNAAHQLARLIGRPGLLRVGHPMRCPVPVLDHGAQKIVGQPDAEVFVLEHDRAVRFAIEIAGIALFDQGAGFPLFILLGFNELLDIRVPDFEGVHLRCAAGFAARLDDAGDGVVHAQERQRATGAAAAGKFLTSAAQRGQVGAGAAAVLE